MKKWMMIPAVLLITASVQAALMNGDFSDTTLPIGSNINAESLTDEWVSGIAGTPAYTNDAGVMKRLSSVAVGTQLRAFGQLYGDNLTAGDYVLEFDYTFTAGSATIADIRASVFFFNDPAGSGDLNLTNALRLGNVSEDYVADTFTVSVLADDHLAEGTVLHYQVAFTLSENMVHLDDLGGNLESDWLGIRFSTYGIQADSVFTVDNVSVTAVPEPATIGMLGFGTLATLLTRRLRKG